ncbi:MAG TPA: Fic family protein [Caulobacteraceae bacterium]|nr:Fic family protein [Caulobacteraceae bacterium]
MPRNPLDAFPEVFVSTTAASPLVSRGVRRSELRRIGPKLYTRNLIDPPEQIVRRHLWPLVASYAPGALIADRTAIENVPAADGSVFIVSDRKRNIVLPGLTIRPRKGPGRLESDRPFIGGLFLSSTARAFLDNMTPSRRRGGGVGRTLGREEIETRLDDLIRRNGADGANTLRDEARRIAPLIGREAECAAFETLVGALLGTREEALVTGRGRARRDGAPYDPDRLALFEILHRELRATAPVSRPVRERGAGGRATLAFFDAYFSNFIEGTEFEVNEAADIVFRNLIPRDRPADAHDILGTWRLVSDPVEMARAPRDAASLSHLLKARHATLMAGRPEAGPGAFKREANRAGQTVFVAPDQVEGTLSQGFDLYRGLETPFARAVYMMFLVSEVHPFADGSGRIARVMMNAELVAAREERIVIPTILRSNYLSGLKALSNARNPTTLVRSLAFAQRWVAAVAWSELGATRTILDECHAFMDPAEADDLGIRLRLPGGLAP